MDKKRGRTQYKNKTKQTTSKKKPNQPNKQKKKTTTNKNPRNTCIVRARWMHIRAIKCHQCYRK